MNSIAIATIMSLSIALIASLFYNYIEKKNRKKQMAIIDEKMEYNAKLREANKLKYAKLNKDLEELTVETMKKLELKDVLRKAGTFQVVKINDDAEYVHDGLGLTKERSKALGDITSNALTEMYKKNKDGIDLILLLEFVSKECKHANELAFVTHVITKSIDKSYSNPFSSFMDMMRREGKE